jgi:uncharacterized membrane protein
MCGFGRSRADRANFGIPPSPDSMPPPACPDRVAGSAHFGKEAAMQDTPDAQVLTNVLELAAVFLELCGVAAIAIAVVLASVKFAGDLRKPGKRCAYNHYRANLGRGILLGLELLVGADIIMTVTAPLTWNTVGLLAAVVVIRTFLSFSLETEIEGQWPWRRQERETSQERR